MSAGIIPDELRGALLTMKPWRDRGRCLVCNLIDSERWLIAWTRLQFKLHGMDLWPATDVCPLCGSCEGDRQMIAGLKQALDTLIRVQCGGQP